MIHADHVALLRDGIPAPGGVWADLGSGTGAFTLALADLIGPGGVIYSVEKDSGALREQRHRMRECFPGVSVQYLTADFTRPLHLPPLDGIVMANSLHYISPRHKPEVLRRLRGYLRPGGRMLMVEYNVDVGNIWVPHPLSYSTWVQLAREAGYSQTRLLATAPSRFLNEFYSAESV